MGEARAQAQRGQKPRGLLAGFAARFARDHLRQDDIFQRVEFRQQMMGLIDKADGVAADAGAVLIRQARSRRAVDIDLAAGGRFQQARHMQQRGFARAGLADQGHDLAGLQASC